MEDEHGDVGQGSSGGVVSDSPLSDDLPVVENSGVENRVEDSYEEGDGGEIMVEIVGSDVFVDGISGHHKEADFMSEEVGDCKNSEESPNRDVSGEENVNSTGENESGVSESRDEKEYAVTEEVDTTLSASVSALSSRSVNVWNPGIEEMAVSSSEEKTVLNEVGNDSGEVVLSEPSKAEVLLLPSSDSAPSLGTDSLTFEGANKETNGGETALSEVSPDPNCEGSGNVKVDGGDGVVEDVGLIKDGSFGDNVEPASTDGDCLIEDKLLDEKEVFAAESKDSVLETLDLVSVVRDESQGCINESDEIKSESNHGIDGVSHASQDTVHEESVVGERGEATDEDFDDVMDSEDGSSDINPPVKSLGNDECGGLLETNMVDQNQVVSNEPRHLADESDTAVVNKDNGPSDEIEADTEEKQTNTTSPTFPKDEEIVQADSVGEVKDLEISEQSLVCKGNVEIPAGDASTENMQLLEEGKKTIREDSGMVKDQHVIVTTVGEAIDNEKAREVVDGGEKGEMMDFEILEQSLEASTETMQLLEQGVCSKVETADVSVTENRVVFDNIVEQRDSPQVKEEEVPANTTETSNHRVDNLESIDFIPFEVADITAIPDIAQVSILPETTERSEANDDSIETNGFYIEGEDDTSETELMDVELGTDNSKLSSEETVKSASSPRMNLSSYLSPPDNEGVFGISDLVWGKVRSHPWWPGQIFDPEDASEEAVKYYKKDSYLVAYFGDRTFAWNDSSLLKPFRSYFSQIEKQSNSESFQNAVECALDEVSRRVELGLACSCISKDAYAEIETQVVQNTGIREESSLRYGVDRSSGTRCFEPDKLVDYVRNLAPNSSYGADRLDLAIAQSQLSAFYRFKGYRPITEFPPIGELLEMDEEISDELAGSKDELMGEMEYSLDAENESAAGRKRKAIDPYADVSDKRVNTPASAKISTPTIQTPKPSFKIGECIRRVASQLTGTTSSVVVKGSGEETISPKIYEHSEMLSKLQILAQNPKKNHSFINGIHNFFMGFRSSIALNKRGRKKKADSAIGGSGEEFEFDDVNDSYWTDRIVHNYPEEQQLINNNNIQNGARNFQLVPFDSEKNAKSTRKPHSRKRYSTGNYPTEATEIDEAVKRRKQETSPAELILQFAERKYVPSEINLNKMFRRFGSLMESETEVDHESGCAKVVFKRGSDAEVARNSSEKFGIFGPVLVNYQIGYSPLISVKVSPLQVEMPQYQADMELMI